MITHHFVQNCFKFFFRNLTGYCVLLPVILPAGCGSRELPPLYIYCNETFWYVMQEEAAVFSRLYGFQIIMLPVGSRDAGSEESGNADHHAENNAETGVEINGRTSPNQPPVPWQSMPKRVMESVVNRDPQAQIHPDIDKEIDGIAISGLGDLFVTDSKKQVMKLQKSALSAGAFPVCYLKLVLLVPKGNPHQFKSAKEVLDARRKLGIVDPSLDGLGEKSWEMIHRLSPGHPPEVSADLIKMFSRQYDLLEALEKKEIDAALAWDATSEMNFLLIKYSDEYNETYKPLLQEVGQGKNRQQNIRAVLQEIGPLMLKEKGFAESVPLTDVPNERTVEAVSVVALGTAADYGYSVRFADFIRSPQGQRILKNFGFTGRP
ncbi:MAG: substrate-binding domain-containing protein [Planctomycetaceae bacterium]|jgi:ABC-type molybdate transport system substrate-binding protein|nr:substrate-binding domain-containing protein [Planctomycetaceae bacterium]